MKTNFLSLFKYQSQFVLVFFIFLLLIVPFFVFDSSRYIVGGDDSLLYYMFPYEFLRNYAVHIISETTLGSVGYYSQQLYLIPFVSLVLIFKTLLPFINTQLLFFGLNFSGGFFFFYLFLGLWISTKNWSLFFTKVLASFMYIFSLFSLYTVWQHYLFSLYLVSVFPLILYLFFRGVQEGKKVFIVLCALILSIFSVLLLSVPWFIALLIVTLPLLFLLFLQHKKRFLLYSLLLIVLVFFLNFYWLFHFLYAPFSSDYAVNDIFSKTTSQSFRDENVQRIDHVIEGNTILYPFFNLFQKSVQERNQWDTVQVFETWHERFLSINGLFLLIFLCAFFVLYRVQDLHDRTLFLVAFLSWIIALFFVTAQISGWGRDLFVWFNNAVPGFTMFRNMYDKFGMAFAFVFAFLLAISMKVLLLRFKSVHIHFSVLFLISVAVFTHAFPFIVGKYNAHTLWTTDYTQRTIQDFNNDFYDLAAFIRILDTSSRFVWFPLNTANYALIEDRTAKNHLYAGVSPLQLFTQKNDLVGRLSFPDYIQDRLVTMVRERRYQELGLLLQQYNVEYVIVQNQLSSDVVGSYLYSNDFFVAQNSEEFHNILLGEKIKDFGERYSLYSLHDRFSNKKIYLTDNYTLFPQDYSHVSYEKISSFRYNVTLKNITGFSKIVFLDPYHRKWQWRVQDSQKNIFFGPHDIVFDYANGWTLNVLALQSLLSRDEYTVNSDGSINLHLELYFQPQEYTHYNIILSVITFLGCALSVVISIFLIKKKRL